MTLDVDALQRAAQDLGLEWIPTDTVVERRIDPSDLSGLAALREMGIAKSYRMGRDEPASGQWATITIDQEKLREAAEELGLEWIPTDTVVERRIDPSDLSGLATLRKMGIAKSYRMGRDEALAEPQRIATITINRKKLRDASKELDLDWVRTDAIVERKVTVDEIAGLRTLKAMGIIDKFVVSTGENSKPAAAKKPRTMRSLTAPVQGRSRKHSWFVSTLESFGTKTQMKKIVLHKSILNFWGVNQGFAAQAPRMSAGAFKVAKEMPLQAAKFARSITNVALTEEMVAQEMSQEIKPDWCTTAPTDELLWV